MKNLFLLITLFFTLSSFQDKEQTGTPVAFETGEWFKFRIHYMGVNAGIAELELTEAVRENKKVFHAKGKGYTTGMTRWFFKVEDDYQSFFDKHTGKPYQYVRKINEGGYTKNQEGFFDQTKKNVLIKNYKDKTEKIIQTTDNVQDIVSAFYYLRNYDYIDTMKNGESVEIDMFFDDEITKFKLKKLGIETIDTKFGKVECLIFRPLVQAGRVFKEQESLTVWISNDKNKIPLRIKASLVVGSLKGDLEGYKGLKNQFVVRK